MNRLWELTFVEASKDWDVSRNMTIALFFAPGLAFFAAGVLRMVDRAHWSMYWQEGGPVEWLQFLFLVVAMLFSLFVSKRMFADRGWILAFLYLMLAMGLFFVAGEEILWGQDILGYETPAALAQSNYKAEMSVHNVSSLVIWFDVGKLLIGAYGSFAVFGLMRLSRRIDTASLMLIVPPLFLTSPFIIMLVQRLLRFTLITDNIPVGYGEFEELCFYYGIMMFTWLVWRRIRRYQNFDLPTAPSF